MVAAFPESGTLWSGFISSRLKSYPEPAPVEESTSQQLQEPPVIRLGCGTNAVTLAVASLEPASFDPADLDKLSVFTEDYRGKYPILRAENPAKASAEDLRRHPGQPGHGQMPRERSESNPNRLVAS